MKKFCDFVEFLSSKTEIGFVIALPFMDSGRNLFRYII